MRESATARQTGLAPRPRHRSTRRRRSPPPALAGHMLAGHTLACAGFYPARHQHAAAATERSAMAGKHLIDICGIIGIALDLIIVGEFLAGPDGAQSLDENTPVGIDGLAIRLAAMIHKTRLVAVDAGIDDRFSIHREQKCVAIIRILVSIATIRLGRAHPIAEIFDDGHALADLPQRKHAMAVNTRVTNLEQRCRWPPRLSHTAMGALMASW